MTVRIRACKIPQRSSRWAPAFCALTSRWFVNGRSVRGLCCSRCDGRGCCCRVSGEVRRVSHHAIGGLRVGHGGRKDRRREGLQPDRHSESMMSVRGDRSMAAAVRFSPPRCCSLCASASHGRGRASLPMRLSADLLFPSNRSRPSLLCRTARWMRRRAQPRRSREQWGRGASERARAITRSTEWTQTLMRPLRMPLGDAFGRSTLDLCSRERYDQRAGCPQTMCQSMLSAGAGCRCTYLLLREPSLARSSQTRGQTFFALSCAVHACCRLTLTVYPCIDCTRLLTQRAEGSARQREQ